MFLHFVVCISQIVLGILEVFKIRYSYEDKAGKLAITTIFLVGIWITVTSFGLAAILEGNWYLAINYVVSAGLGKYIAIKLFPNRVRNQVWKKMLGK